MGTFCDFSDGLDWLTNTLSSKRPRDGATDTETGHQIRTLLAEQGGIDTLAQRCQTVSCPDTGACCPPLLRDPLWRQVLALRAAGRCAHRGDHARIGYSLRRNKYRQRQRPMALRQPVLRARSGREPD